MTSCDELKIAADKVASSARAIENFVLRGQRTDISTFSKSEQQAHRDAFDKEYLPLAAAMQEAVSKLIEIRRTDGEDFLECPEKLRNDRNKYFGMFCSTQKSGTVHRFVIMPDFDPLRKQWTGFAKRDHRGHEMMVLTWNDPTSQWYDGHPVSVLLPHACWDECGFAEITFRKKVPNEWLANLQ